MNWFWIFYHTQIMFECAFKPNNQFRLAYSHIMASKLTYFDNYTNFAVIKCLWNAFSSINQILMISFISFRVVRRRWWYPPQVKMHPCLLLVWTRRNTSQTFTLFQMPAVPPTALLLSQRFVLINPKSNQFFLLEIGLIQNLLCDAGYKWQVRYCWGPYDHRSLYHR